MPKKAGTVTLPENEQAESALLAAILHDNTIMDYALARVKADYFASTTNKSIFKGMESLHDQRKLIDEATLSDYCQNSSTTDTDFLIKLSELRTGYPPRSREATEAYTQIILANSQKRELIKLGQSWANRINKPGETIDGLLESAQRHLKEIAGTVSLSNILDIPEALALAMSELERTIAGKSLNLKTGIRPLDDMLGGLCEQELIVIAARTSVGKTALAVQAAHHILTHQNPVAFFSLEMSIPKIISRFNMFQTDLSVKEQRHHENFPKTVKGYEKIRALPLFCSDLSRIRASQLSIQAKNLVNTHPVKAVFIDYLGLIEPEKKTQDNRNLEISYITRELKILAGELRIPIILLSQLNRENEKRSSKEAEPRLSDLRDSGSIEQDADKVIFIHRPDCKTNSNDPFDRGKLIVAKNRNGELGSVAIDFQRPLMKFIA